MIYKVGKKILCTKDWNTKLFRPKKGEIWEVTKVDKDYYNYTNNRRSIRVYATNGLYEIEFDVGSAVDESFTSDRKLIRKIKLEKILN